jgi:hypothetical protein
MGKAMVGGSVQRDMTASFVLAAGVLALHLLFIPLENIDVDHRQPSLAG